MRPLILEFTENPPTVSQTGMKLHYDDRLGLSVDIETQLPAIDCLAVGTETFTRADEDTDSDQNGGHLLATSTATKVGGERSDSDPSSPLHILMATSTHTASHNEGTDSDLDRPERQYFPADFR